MEGHAWAHGGVSRCRRACASSRGRGHHRLAGLLLRSGGAEFLSGLIEQQAIKAR